MIRTTAEPGDVWTIRIPVESSGPLRTIQATIVFGILVQKIEDGKVTLVAENPRLEKR